VPLVVAVLLAVIVSVWLKGVIHPLTALKGNGVAARCQAGDRGAAALPGPAVHLPLRPGAYRPGGSKRDLQ
jgi:hypothetical protein